MLMLKDDTWRYTEEDGHQKYDMSSTTADWQEEQQVHGYDDDTWQTTQDDSWQQQEQEQEQEQERDYGDDEWNTRDRVDDESSEWRLTDDTAAGSVDNYDSNWTTEYSSNTADDNNYSNDYWLRWL